MAAGSDGWVGTGWDWTDAAEIRRRLDGGAGPEHWSGGRPLHRAAVSGSPQVVAELAGRVADVDATGNGVTALWEAVVSRKPDNAWTLAAAGADPWRPSLGGWSPGRLGLAGPAPDLFPVPGGECLTGAERAVAQEAHRLTTELGTFCHDGTGLACVAGTVEGRDLHPGGGPDEHDTPEEVLVSYLYRGNAVAYSCAFAGLRPNDARGVVGPPDARVELPHRDYWDHWR
ncbi:ankyrin repeat domain-containing protein [Streptomyces sp. PU_AKi4]|uniref:ankyrin repeat domain-containing protein n=1 Tax=Streptomyces sp. PU_AKi4 TaxID=2800809 RepID=UPI00352647FB